MAAGVLIIGAGQAGLQAAVSLRQGGYDAPIRIVGEEAHPPYQRPPLSKAVLAGEAGLDTVALRAPAFYVDNAIDLVTGARVAAIDPAGQTATLAGGSRLPYAHLVLATGTRVRRLPVPGAELPGVLYLRGLDDAIALKAELEPGRAVVVVGGGYIGLEVAASATKLGGRVTVLEALPRVLARSVAPVMAEAMVRRHAEKGVVIRCGAAVARIEGAGRVAAVVLADGARLPADLVVVGIGVVPNEELARAAGLDCADGIVTDAFVRTGDPRILAVGDVARTPSPFADAPVRLESVQNAIDEGKTAAATILGRKEPYSAVPWFWSDQFDMKLQTAGLAAAADQIVVRGVPESGAFSVFSLRGGRIIAVDSLNRPADHMAGRRLVSASARVPAADLADLGFDLKRAAQEPASQMAARQSA